VGASVVAAFAAAGSAPFAPPPRLVAPALDGQPARSPAGAAPGPAARAGAARCPVG